MPIVRTRAGRVAAASIALWLAVPVLVAGLLGSDALRAGARSYLACWLVLIAWFVVARTKTLSWSWAVRLFVAAIPVAVVTALVSDVLAASVDLDVSDSGVAIGIAGTLEELMKLAPLLVLCLVVPERVRRFSYVDWLLAGVASGLGFQAAEDAVRRIAWTVSGAADQFLLGGGDPWSDPRSGYPHYRWSLLSGSADMGGHAVFPGHHVLTGLIAVAIGVAVATRGSTLRRCVAWALPVAAAVLAVAAHVGFTATIANQLMFDAGDTEVPRPLYLAWKATDRGRLVGPLLVVVLLAAIMVDAARLRRAETRLPPHPGGPLPDVPGRWDRIGQRLRRRGEVDGPGPAWFGVTADAAASIGRDVVAIGRALRRPDGTEPGPGRWAATVAIERERRSLERAGDDVASARTVRVGAVVVAVAGTVVAVIAGRRMATGIGQFLAGPGSPALAGLLDDISAWWSSLGVVGQLAAVAGTAALVGLSAGDFGLPPAWLRSPLAGQSPHRAARAGLEVLAARLLPTRPWPEDEPDLAALLLDDPEGFAVAYPAMKPPAPRIPITSRAASREREVERLLAARGLTVEHLTPRPGDPSPVPDLLLGARRFDCVTLSTGDARQIATVLEVRVARGVGTRFVLDLGESEADLQVLRRQLDRHPVHGLEEVIVVRGDRALRFFP